MKNELAFLFPPPRTVHFKGASLDMSSLCFPLEISKKYGFLFDHFPVKNRNSGLEIVFQERSGLAPEEYAMDCAPGRIVLSSSHSRGQFYALSTLLQILAFHGASGRIPAFSLRDAPQIAFRGFLLGGGAGAVPGVPELQGMLLKLALLKFNHVALPAAVLGRTTENSRERDGWKALAVQARAMGLAIIWVDGDEQAVFQFDAGPPSGKTVFDPPALPVAEGAGDGSQPEEWLDFFLARHRRGRVQGKKTVVWGDIFLRHDEWIRKIPQDVMVLNRGTPPGRSDLSGSAMRPFRKHHIPQVLCPILCGRDRFIPDCRSGMDLVRDAYSVASTGKLAGVMLAGGEPEGSGCLPEGAAMLHFLAGCLLWSGHAPGPAAFSRWMLGRDEPDLFRVYSFLAQAEHRLPHAHGRYLFEDPLFAPFSSQGDPREIEAHFRKAALYLEKRALTGVELAGFIAFCRHLYEFIAVKVRFSARIRSFLRDESGMESLRLEAAWLQQETLKLKALHGELQARHFQPGGRGRGRSGFDLLSGRFADLVQTACRPTGRQDLLAELENEPPPGSPAGFPPAGF
jgi:hypothetical protein